jgi:hypothetical protein
VKSFGATVNTKFHIDFSWWEKQNKDIHVFMHDLLCPECQSALTSSDVTATVDMVDPDTAEVRQVDAMWEAIQSCCGLKPDFVPLDAPILDSIFRILLANGNKPLSALELHDRLPKRPADLILRMLIRGQVYMGIRPA